MTKTQRLLIALTSTVAVLALAACGSSSTTATSSGGGTSAGTSTTSSGGESAAPAPAAADATSAATGDIPDNQVFLTFDNSKAGYTIQYPEGWTQKGNGDNVTFSDRGNTVQVSVAPGSPASAVSVQASLAKLKKADPTISAQAPATVSLKHGPAIKATYTLQSAPDPVTGKRQPLIVDRYVYSHGGKVATVDLGTVKGVDNVDAYRLISNSFSWK